MSNKGKYYYTFWVCFTIGLMIGGFIFGFTKHAHGEPRVKPPVVVDNSIEDGRQEIVFYNPNFKKISVIVDCGKEFERSVVELFPRVTQRFQFSSYPCRVAAWRKAR